MIEILRLFMAVVVSSAFKDSLREGPFLFCAKVGLRKTLVIVPSDVYSPNINFCNVNNSPGVFFLHSHGCEYRRGMYSHRDEFPQESGEYVENDPSKSFSCIRASVNTGPACIRAKINSPRFFPACIGFVPGGINSERIWVL